jgi:hypothetical protein
MFAAGHPTVGRDRYALVQQVLGITAIKYTISTAGAYVQLTIQGDSIGTDTRRMRLSGIDLVIEGLSNGACLVVFVDDGLLNCLELATYGENLPTDWHCRVQGIKINKNLQSL